MTALFINHWLLPKYCTIKYYACKLDTKQCIYILFILKVVDLFRFLFHYSIKFVNERNRVFLCIHLWLNKQFFKFGQNSGHKTCLTWHFLICPSGQKKYGSIYQNRGLGKLNVRLLKSSLIQLLYLQFHASIIYGGHICRYYKCIQYKKEHKDSIWKHLHTFLPAETSYFTKKYGTV